MNLNKHIWEGWLVKDFIKELEPMFNMIQEGRGWRKKFESEEELKIWCRENQPYYKKHIPEVFNYFKKRINVK